MVNNLCKYLKCVKMTGEMFRIEAKINTQGLKRDKVSFINYPNIEVLYKKTYDCLYEDDIKYKELLLIKEKH